MQEESCSWKGHVIAYAASFLYKLSNSDRARDCPNLPGRHWQTKFRSMLFNTFTSLFRFFSVENDVTKGCKLFGPSRHGMEKYST